MTKRIAKKIFRRCLTLTRYPYTLKQIEAATRIYFRRRFNRDSVAESAW